MKKQKTLRSAKRFGSRYGKRVKEKVAAIERVQKAKHKCPYCHYRKVRRLAVGIWQCNNCDSKFTGKAYTISKRKTAAIFEEESPEEILAEEEMEEEELPKETPVVFRGNEEALASVKAEDIEKAAKVEEKEEELAAEESPEEPEEEPKEE